MRGAAAFIWLSSGSVNPLGMRILVVEDDRKLGPVLVRGFATDSIAADLVTNGRDAIVRAGATDYAVIVLDVMLPDRDGFDVCHSSSGAASPSRSLTGAR